MPPILLSVALLLAGLLLLVKGSDFFIDGASEIAKRWGVSEMLIGLTLVAFGTSLPEWISSLIAAFRDPSTLQCAEGIRCNTTDMALGNVVGSNITNIGLVIGLVGLMVPAGIKAKSAFLFKDIPLLMLLSVGIWYLALQDNMIGKYEGLLIFVLFVAVTIDSVRNTKDENEDEEGDEESEEEGSENIPSWKLYGLTLGGLVALLIGSTFLVDGASAIALAMGVSESVVGLTMVAFGTSVPELATSITAAKRGKHAMLLGGVIGSNSANLAVILGSVAFLFPVEVQPEFAMFQFPVMIAYVFSLWLSMLSGTIQKWQSVLMLLGYFAFTAALFF